jgi:hypothetical protein
MVRIAEKLDGKPLIGRHLWPWSQHREASRPPWEFPLQIWLWACIQSKYRGFGLQPSVSLMSYMRSGDLAPMGGVGSVVEADETFTGRREGSIKRRGHGHKNTVLSLVDRKTKQVRSFHIDGVSATFS